MPLEPLDPTEAVEWYLEDKKAEYAHLTWKTHTSRLKYFLQWCATENIDNMNDVSGRDLQRFKSWRREDGDLAKASLKGQLSTLRQFLRYCEDLDGVQPNLYESVQLPSMSDDEASPDVMVDGEEAIVIREQLSRFRYASLWHTLVELLLCGLRVGSIHALDVDDYRENPETGNPMLTVRHRPETDTTLKNGDDGERNIAITTRVADVLDDWIAHNRPAKTDSYGREPLLTTRTGRANTQTLRDISYKITRPCWYGDDCPHDRDPEECVATESGGDEAFRCPSAKSPHPWRRGVITRMLRETDAPDRAVSGRFNVDPDTIDRHYDRRTEREKMESRRRWAKDLEE